jgi:3-methyladenine DNA glycosylase AlkD
MLAYTSSLQAFFQKHRNAENAEPMKKYMRNQYEFLGIKSPERQSLLKQFVKENGMPPKNEMEQLIRDLWELPEREYQVNAFYFLEKMKPFEKKDINMLEDLITTKSWWDTVDGLATQVCGRYFKEHPDQIIPITGRWIDSTNIWLQRTAILFQLKYKTETDVDLLFTYILKGKDSDEFFIQKAIGWALREYSKTDAEAVIHFIEKHKLKPLSKREGLKWLKNKGHYATK